MAAATFVFSPAGFFNMRLFFSDEWCQPRYGFVIR